MEQNFNELKDALITLAESFCPTGKAHGLSAMLAKLQKAKGPEGIAKALVPQWGDGVWGLDQAFYQRLAELLEAAFEPAVWQRLGILLHPERIPVEGLNRYIAICAAPGWKCVQDVEKQVTYLGDVELEISNGWAQVGGRSKVDAHTYARVYASERAEVFATGYGLLHLCGQSRAEVDEHVVVSARDESLVEVLGGQPRVDAIGQSQVLVSAGAPELYFDECARGVVLSEGYPVQPVRVRTGETGLVYVLTSDPDRIRVEDAGLNGVVLYGDRLQLSTESMRDLLVPRYRGLGRVYQAPLVQPLPIGELLASMRIFLSELDEKDQQALREAEDEETVCDLILPYLPRLLDYGLTGDFLRTHFTEDTLLDHGIFVRFNFEAWHYENYREKAYFFGDQLVRGDDYADKVYAYEQAFVLTGSYSRETCLHDQASCYVMGVHTLYGEGEGVVIANGTAQVHAEGKLTVQLLDRSSCEAKGDALVYANDTSSVSGLAYSRLVLGDKSQAKLDDHSTAIVQGACPVEAKGEAVIWYGSFDPEKQPAITVLSDKVHVIEVDNELELNGNKAFLALYPTTRRQG